MDTKTYPLETEIAYFKSREAEFLKSHRHEWVLIEGETVLGFFKDFQLAGDAYESRYTGEPMLLRQIGFEPQLNSRINFAVL